MMVTQPLQVFGLYLDIRGACSPNMLWHLDFVANHKNDSCTYHLIIQLNINSMVLKKHFCFHMMNLFHMNQLTCMNCSISSSWCQQNIQKWSLVLNDGDVQCHVPLNILAPNLTFKTETEYALKNSTIKMHKYYLKITNVKCMKIFLLYSGSR